MKKTLVILLFAGLAPLGTLGCGNDSYSAAIVYAVRSDPLILNEKEIAPETIAPDRPGVLPMLSAKDVFNPNNPLYEKRDTLFDEKLLDPAKIDKKDRRLLEDYLNYYFGSPARPLVRDIDSLMRDVLKVDEVTLERGASAYRIHCLNCHGVTGDGRGPTARWVNPHPRDYRQGLFKFMSVDQTTGAKPPRRDDLFRILQQGVEATAMPSFVVLPAAELENLVSYVIHLSIRGKVEFNTLRNVFNYDAKKDSVGLDTTETDDKKREEFLAEGIASIHRLVIEDWYNSQNNEKAIKVSAYPYKDWEEKNGERVMSEELKNSILRGHQLFIGKGDDKGGPAMPLKAEAEKANCVSCHKDYGRQALFKVDNWGTMVKPRDLTLGIYRGGRRPVDIYYRVHSGISGSGMTPFAEVLKTESVWDLVNFVQTLPYAAMRRNVGIHID
ncbi:MAG: cytochrome c [Gemmataceae bacterium]|nr:cytochrome c [Gemmataceae bacterium]MCI0739795.1 cytochrome c [Gemmataceae bacterium]